MEQPSQFAWQHSDGDHVSETSPRLTIQQNVDVQRAL